MNLSTPIAAYRDSAGPDRTAMFGPASLLLFGLVGPEFIDLCPKGHSLTIKVYLPGHRLRAHKQWACEFVKVAGK